MAQEINLLHGRNKAKRVIERQANKIKLISFVCLGVYLLLASGLFAYLIWARNEKNRLDRTIQSQKQQITNLKKVESLHLNLKQRLAFLSSQVGLEQNPASMSVDFFNGLKDPKIMITSFSLAEDKQISCVGLATDSLSLSDFLDKLKKQKNKIKTAELTSLSRDELGGYNFNLTLNLH